MVFRIIYNQEYKRVIPAVLIDSRGGISAIETTGGYETKTYTDAQVALVTPTVIPYKIESGAGNLAGYFNLQVEGSNAGLLVMQLRPSFGELSAQISQIINNFIISNVWKEDYLF